MGDVSVRTDWGDERQFRLRVRDALFADVEVLANLQDSTAHSRDHLVVMNDEERRALARAARVYQLRWWPAAVVSFLLLITTTVVTIYSAVHPH